MRKFLIIGTLLSLVACSEPNSDLAQWVQDTSKTAQAPEMPLPATMPYTPYVHLVSEKPNAFDVIRLKLARQGPGGGTSAPDQDRPKEALEAFDLDRLKMVGTLAKSGVVQALVRADDRIYSVQAGSYMGNNYGKVISITPEAILLQETVEDLNGEWTTRETRVELTETEGQ